MSEVNMGALHVEFHCPNCGADKVIIPEDESDGPWIKCGSCDHQLITVKEFNSEVKRVGTDVVAAKVVGRPVKERFRHPALKLGKIE